MRADAMSWRAPPVAADKAARIGDAPLFAAVFLLVLFHSATLRSGSPWAGTGPDLGISIIQGLNIFDGRSYFDASAYTNPASHLAAAPKAYPALYAMLQASLFKYVRYDQFFLVSKLLQNAALFCMLLFFALLARKRAGRGLAMLSIVAFGAAPYVFEFKEQIRSEFYFGAVLYGLFWYFDREHAGAPGRGTWRRGASALVPGFFIYALIAMKSIGIAMVPALLLHDILVKRRLSARVFVSVFAGLALYALQARLLGGTTEATYAREFALTLHDILREALGNARSYYYALSSFFSFAGNGTAVLSAGLLVVSVTAFLIGFVSSLRRSVALHDIFFAGYFAVLLVHETISAWARYLLLFMPFFFYYAFLGLRVAAARLPEGWRNAPRILYLLLLAASFVSVYTTAIAWGPIATGPRQADYLAITQDIRMHTPQTAVIAAREAHWAHLATGRKAALSPAVACCANDAQRASSLDYLGEMHADYVLLKTAPRRAIGFYGLNHWDDEDDPGFRSWVMQDNARFRQISQRGVYRLYVIEN